MFAAPCMTTATMTLKRAPSTTTPIAIARGTTHDANCRKNKGPSGAYNARCQKVQMIPVVRPATARPILRPQPRLQETTPADFLPDDEHEQDELDGADRADPGPAPGRPG